MDIVTEHIPTGKDGVWISELNGQSCREKLQDALTVDGHIA